MKKRKAAFFGWILLSLILVCAGCGAHGDAEQKETRQFLASFEARALDGSSFTQEDLAECDVTIFNFWSLTCGPCIREMPDLARYEKSLPDHVRLITVCMDGAGDVEGTKRILEEAGYEGVTLLEGDGDFEKVCGAIRYTPTTVLVDGDGNLLGKAIVGAQKNLERVYSDAVGEALKAMGKGI